MCWPRTLLRESSFLGLLVASRLLAAEAPSASSCTFNVRDHGARGDGHTLETAAFQKALDAASAAGGGTVLVPPGRYLSGTLQLRSHVTLHLEPGARLIGTTNLNEYRHPIPPADLPEAKWGKWHRALLLGEGVEHVTLSGPGIIDGNKVFDPTGEERMRGPHSLVFVNSSHVTVRELSFVDAANYAVFFMVSDDVEFRGVTFVGGWDGIHWRGAPKRWCRNVSIVGCEFYTGDDAIAGRYWDNTLIRDCIINSSCNGIRLIGPARTLLVNDCLFFGPGRQPHRTSGERRRTNMLSGIILQPGAWDATEGILDDVLLTGNTMHNVASAVTLWTKPGNTVGRVTITDLTATQIYRAAFSVESWAETPITNVVLRQARLEFTGGGKTGQGLAPVRGPGVDARPLPAWGVYARNVHNLTLEDVRLSLTDREERPVVVAEGIHRLVMDQIRLPDEEPASHSLILTNVAECRIVESPRLKPSGAAPTP